VVYVPVVEKKLYFRKNNKNPELAGKLKEIIPQISQNRKWPPRVQVERDGKTYTVNSYSLLQDRYHTHMKKAGFDGFERGERGSTTEHLEVLDYKIQQDTKRLDSISKKVEIKTAKLEKLDTQITNREKAKASIAQIEAMGKPAILGGFNFTVDETKTLKTLAKKSLNANKKIAEANRKLKTAEDERDKAVTELASIKKTQPSIKEHLNWYSKFIAAMKRAPKRLMAVIEDILKSPPEQSITQERSNTKQRSEER
jgi:chromosome segregation ATPase